VLCYVIPAKAPFFGVDPTRLELVTSAMRGRSEGLLRFSGACKTPANSSILMIILSQYFRIFTRVAAQTLRLLHPHKGWDDRYATNYVEI
jgi:hypothetical protein